MKTVNDITVTNVIDIREGHRIRAARQAENRQMKRNIVVPVEQDPRRDGRAVRRRPRPAA